MWVAKFADFMGYPADHPERDRLRPGEIHFLIDKAPKDKTFTSYCGFSFPIPFCDYDELKGYELARLCPDCIEKAERALGKAFPHREAFPGWNAHPRL